MCAFTPASAFLSIAQVNVLTYHNDNARTGQNLNETLLTPANVNSNTFGRLFLQNVDGQVYAQPLYMANVAITNQGMHNVVFVATEHDSVYAFDADSNAGSNAAPLWQVSFINPAASVTTVPYTDVACVNLAPEIGVTGTPVIDPATGTLYVEAKTKEVSGANTSYVHRLHALDIGSGQEKFGGPVVIQPTSPGTGNGTDGAGHISFDGRWQMNRPGLLLVNETVYIAYGSHGDIGPYHGWLLGFDARSLQPNGVLNLTPNGGLGGIWQGGDGPAADANGNIYFITGNGTFDATNGNYGDSFARVTPGGTNLTVADYFTPYDQQNLADSDLDLGSGGLLLLPDSVGAVNHPHLLAGAGKGGTIYLLDRDNLGQFNAADNSQAVQTLVGGAVVWSYGTPAYWNNLLYYVGANDHLKAFNFSGGRLNPNPVSTGMFFAWPGATPSISADGTNNGIVWVLQSNAANLGYGAAILHAFNATNLAQELYDTSQTGGRDYPGDAVKYTVPTIANGKVYVGGSSSIAVFGNGVWAAAPIIAPNGGVFTNSVTISLSSGTAGAQIYYTLDGTPPTTNSALYAGPFPVTNTATVKAMATKSGIAESGISLAFFNLVSPATTIAGFGGNGSGWMLNGGTVVSNEMLILTDGQPGEARSAFFLVPQPVGAFTAQFLYQCTDGANGMAFVAQNSALGAGALGGAGGCLGLCGITPNAALEFNLFDQQGGSATRYASNGVTGGYATTLPVDLDSGNPTLVTLVYDGTNLTEHLVDQITGQTYDASFAANIPTDAGGATAIIGFTGGTSTNEASVQTIRDFTFGRNNPPGSSAPVLGVGWSGQQIVITWPTPTASYVLEFTTNLTPAAVWSPAQETNVIIGQQTTVTINVGKGNTFYRLHKQ